MADIRLLLPADAAAYLTLRLQAFEQHPQAFTSSAEEEAQKPLSWSVQRLTPEPSKPHDAFWGAFEAGALVGMVGLHGRYRPKEQHNATVVGMYVAQAASGRGLGRALLQALLAQARQCPTLEQVDLTVTAGNLSAQHLYEACGFKVYGVLPHAVKVNGQDHAKVLMVLRLHDTPAQARD